MKEGCASYYSFTMVKLSFAHSLSRCFYLKWPAKWVQIQFKQRADDTSFLDYDGMLCMHVSKAALKSLDCWPFSFKVQHQIRKAEVITVISVIALLFQLEDRDIGVLCIKRCTKKWQCTFLKMHSIWCSTGEIGKSKIWLLLVIVTEINF